MAVLSHPGSKPCQIGYRRVSATLPFPALQGSLEGGFFYPFYGPDDPSIAGFSPDVQSASGTQRLIAHTRDGELTLCVRKGDQDTEDTITGSAAPTNYFSSMVNKPTTAAPPVVGHRVWEVKENGCAIVENVYVQIGDMDAPGEYIDEAVISAPFAYTSNHGSFNTVGTVVRPTAQNQVYSIGFAGNPGEQEFLGGNDAQGGQFVFVVMADYFRPLERCGKKWIDRDGSEYEGEVFSPDDISALGLSTVGECCSKCTDAPDMALPAPPVPADQVFPDQEVCDGPFVQRSSRTGWVFQWTAIATANTGTVTDDWENVGSAEVAPDCLSDMAVSVFAGDHYFQIIRCRMRQWMDFRILVNGVAVFTENFDHYEYLDERTDTNPDVLNPNHVIIRTGGSWFAERKNVPAGATVQVQMRRRYNFNAFQTGGRARLISGLRSKSMFVFSPRDIVTGRL